MKKAFTLIELLVVVSIIGVLAVALVPTIGSAPAKARDAARKTKVGEVIKAIEMYNIDNSGYPTGKFCAGDPDAVDAEGNGVDLSEYLGAGGIDLQGTVISQANLTCGSDDIEYRRVEDGYWIIVGVENESSATHVYNAEAGADLVPAGDDQTNNVYAVQR